MIPPTNPLRARPALGLAVIATVIIVAALGVLAAIGDEGGEMRTTEMVASTSSTTPGATTVSATTTGELPAAPWRAPAVAREAVPEAYAAAWDRARNRATCALLFPIDGGPALQEAEATADPTPGDNGWDIFLTGGAASIEVLGLFDKASQTQKAPGAATYTRTWADGSVAKYGADVGNAAPGTYDPNISPFEAVLTLPDQSCAYRIYDTLGKDHIEFLFDRLRLMAG